MNYKFLKGHNMTTEPTTIPLYHEFLVEYREGNPYVWKEYTKSFKTFEEALSFYETAESHSFLIKLCQLHLYRDNDGDIRHYPVILNAKDIGREHFSNLISDIYLK